MVVPSEKQRNAAGRNVKKAQSAAKRRKTLKNLPRATRTALRREAKKVASGQAKTRKQLESEARRLEIRGRSKMGKDELRRAIARAR